MQERFRLGIDIGGTFTDIVLYNETEGNTSNLKIPSSRKDPSEPVVKGSKQIIAAETIEPQSISMVVHGCTIATNAIIERSGVKTGLIETKGFKGILEIGRLETINPLSLSEDKLAPLVPKGLVKEIRGRMSSVGKEIEPLSEEDVVQAARELAEQNVKSIGICLLNSYANPVHERKAKIIVERILPKVIVLSGTEIWAEIGEYERAYIAGTPK